MSKNPKSERLIEAIRSNDEAGVSTVCALGDDVDGIAFGGTPLISAAESGFISILRLLLGLHANSNLATPSGNYPLRAAIAGGDGECIMELIASGANVNMETARGTPLTTAAGLGDVSTIRVLVSGRRAYFLRTPRQMILTTPPEPRRRHHAVIVLPPSSSRLNMVFTSTTVSRTVQPH